MQQRKIEVGGKEQVDLLGLPPALPAGMYFLRAARPDGGCGTAISGRSGRIPPTCRSGFCRVHKSFLVNLHHIKEYVRGEGGSVILTNDMVIEVSRRKKEVFMARMKELFNY